MKWIDEYGCSACGASLMRPATRPLEEETKPAPLNECRECGHHSELRVSFHWEDALQTFVLGKWPDIDMKAFRLDPRGFVEEKLNPWLKERGAGRVTVVESARAPRFAWSRL